jgi:hypothetical protein
MLNELELECAQTECLAIYQLKVLNTLSIVRDAVSGIQIVKGPLPLLELYEGMV